MKAPSLNNSVSRRLKICIGVTIITVIAIGAIVAILWFTLLKPKDPVITAQPLGLEKIDATGFPVVNVTLGMIITIDNKKNFGSFEFRDTTGYINYHGEVVGEVPMAKNVVPARGKITVTSSTDLMVEKMTLNPEFMNDVITGSLNLSSTATFYGKVSLFHIFKMKAMAISTCEITFSIEAKDVNSICKTKIYI